MNVIPPSGEKKLTWNFGSGNDKSKGLRTEIEGVHTHCSAAIGKRVSRLNFPESTLCRELTEKSSGETDQ